MHRQNDNTISSDFRSANGDTWTATITAGKGELSHRADNLVWCVESVITDQGLEGAIFGDVELAWLTGCWNAAQLATRDARGCPVPHVDHDPRRSIPVDETPVTTQISHSPASPHLRLAHVVRSLLARLWGVASCMRFP